MITDSVPGFCPLSQLKIGIGVNILPERACSWVADGFVRLHGAIFFFVSYPVAERLLWSECLMASFAITMWFRRPEPSLLPMGSDVQKPIGMVNFFQFVEAMDQIGW